MAKKEIKDVIHDNRKLLGLTQEQLAEKLNVSNKTVSKWETGRSYPDVLLVPAIVKELRISINQFFDCEDAKPDAPISSNKEKLIKIRNNIILSLCLLLFAPIFVIVPTMLLQSIEVAIFCWTSGIVLWFTSVTLAIIENAKIKYLNIAPNDQKLLVSLKNLTGIYSFIWYLIIIALAFSLISLFDNKVLASIAVILIHFVFSGSVCSILHSYSIKLKTVKNAVLLVFSLLTTTIGIVLTLIHSLFPWCLVLLLSQIQNLIILLTSNSIKKH